MQRYPFSDHCQENRARKSHAQRDGEYGKMGEDLHQYKDSGIVVKCNWRFQRTGILGEAENSFLVYGRFIFIIQTVKIHRELLSKERPINLMN